MEAIELEEKRKQLEQNKQRREKELIEKNKKEAQELADTTYLEGGCYEIMERAEEVAKNPTLSDYQKELIDSMHINKNGSISINQLRVGNAFLKEYSIINNERFFYKYDDYNGIWEKATKQTIRSIITRDLEEVCNYWSDSVSRSLSNYVFDKTYGNIVGDTFDQVFNKDPYMITFKNGTLDIETGEFHEGFCKDEYSTIAIPHNYINHDEKPLKTIGFLNMMIEDPEELLFIFQWIGYLLVKKYDIAKMLFLVGDGGNGKSTLIKLMTAIVGAENTSTVSMKSLVTNKFQSALLYNKLFNTVADIGSDFFDDSSILKALTGDDHITIERKGENGFSYLNFAKMTYSCNKLPRFKDTTGGLQRRPIVLPLNKDFINLVKGSDMHINDILNDEEELEKIIKYSADCFRRVVLNGKTFSESNAMIKAKNEWLCDDPLVDFIYEVFDVVESKNFHVEMSDFMKAYKDYCIDRNYKPMSQKNVVEAIKNNRELLNKGIIVSRLSNKGSKLKIQGITKGEKYNWNKI